MTNYRQASRPEYGRDAGKALTKMKRNILLNPGPATTTDTVKMAQLVPDICPREGEFRGVLNEVADGLVKIVHGKPEEHAAVLFCGSGTICMDVCLNSLLPEGKKALIINNGAYSGRAAEICEYYGLPYINFRQPLDRKPNLEELEDVLEGNADISLVYATHHETGTGLLNPIREIGRLTHRHGAAFVTDTTSSYAMLPLDMEADNIDFCMASAQKGIMAMSGLSFIVGRRSLIEASAGYPKRSYYCNLYRQYDYFRQHGEMHFTPPVQVVYAARQALEEYFAEGEEEKQGRHGRVYHAIRHGLEELGFRSYIPEELGSGLVATALYPRDGNWSFERVHDYCLERGYTIYPGKVAKEEMFRLCAYGAIDTDDIDAFFKVFREALNACGVAVPVKY